jgi:uncharacterized protein (DUF1330 family)
MPVYLIIEITIMDQEVYADYVDQVPALMERYGGATKNLLPLSPDL